MKRSFLRALVGTTAMVGAAMVALPNDADAVPIIEGNSAALSVSGSDGGVSVGLDGTVFFQDVAPTSLVFVLAITNTSEAPDPTVENENRITAFGFSIDGKLVDIDDVDADGVWDATFDNGGINRFLNVDICVYQGPTCVGGGNTGLFAEDSALIGVTLTGTFEPPLQFTAFGARFQSTFGPEGSLKLLGTVTDVTDAPEPASLALLGVGLLGVGYATRRRRQAV